MMGPIIIIEDDADDQEIIRDTLLGNGVTEELVFFENAESALEHLSKKEVIPFVIFSDINMAGMNGFQLRDKIHEDPELRVKCIPYIFITTGGENRHVWEAYSKNAQGFFIKPNSMTGWKKLLKNVVDYWTDSKKPRL